MMQYVAQESKIFKFSKFRMKIFVSRMFLFFIFLHTDSDHAIAEAFFYPDFVTSFMFLVW